MQIIWKSSFLYIFYNFAIEETSRLLQDYFSGFGKVEKIGFPNFGKSAKIISKFYKNS